MRIFLRALVALGILFFPVQSAKFIFDLSKGPVSFTYTTTGQYNPIEITIVGENGTVQTVLLSDCYTSQTAIQILGELSMTQLGAVPWLELTIESLEGELSFLASTLDGTTFRVEMSGDPGELTVRLETDGMDADISEQEITAVVQADTESGKLVIEDGSPGPNDALLLSQQYKIPPGEAENLVDRFGFPKVIGAVEAAARYNGWARKEAVAGGAGGLNNHAAVDLADLPPGEIFRISLFGLKYQGILKDSTLFMRLLHPGNGVILKGARIILTVLELDGEGPPDIVLWNPFPYDERSLCYKYRFKPASWKPGAYEVYVDIGRILNFKLPIMVTPDGKVVPRRG